MEVLAIQISKKEAKEKYERYRRLARLGDWRYKFLRRAYWHAAKGRQIIDVPHVIFSAGTNENDEPKLAIARADWANVFCRNLWDAIEFSDSEFGRAGIYNRVIVDNLKVRRTLRTRVPIIPPEVREKHAAKLENYWILWEVDSWEEVPRDPLLLKRLSANLFVVLDTWELTELERAVVRDFTV